MTSREIPITEESLEPNVCDSGCPVVREIDPTDLTKACPYYKFGHEIVDGNRVDIKIFSCSNPAFLAKGQLAVSRILMEEIILGIK